MNLRFGSRVASYGVAAALATSLLAVAPAHAEIQVNTYSRNGSYGCTYQIPNNVAAAMNDYVNAPLQGVSQIIQRAFMDDPDLVRAIMRVNWLVQQEKATSLTSAERSEKQQLTAFVEGRLVGRGYRAYEASFFTDGLESVIAVLSGVLRNDLRLSGGTDFPVNEIAALSDAEVNNIRNKVFNPFYTHFSDTSAHSDAIRTLARELDHSLQSQAQNLWNLGGPLEVRAAVKKCDDFMRSHVANYVPPTASPGQPPSQPGGTGTFDDPGDGTKFAASDKTSFSSDSGKIVPVLLALGGLVAIIVGGVNALNQQQLAPRR